MGRREGNGVEEIGRPGKMGRQREKMEGIHRGDS